MVSKNAYIPSVNSPRSGASDRQEQIFALIARGGDWSVDELYERVRTKMTFRQVRSVLQSLQTAKRIRITRESDRNNPSLYAAALPGSGEPT